MKQVIAFLLAVMMVLSLAGCKQDPSTDNSDKDNEATQEKQTDPTEPTPTAEEPTEEPTETEPDESLALLGTWYLTEDQTEEKNTQLIEYVNGIPMLAGMDFSSYLAVDSYVTYSEYSFNQDGTVQFRYSQKEADEQMVTDLVGDIQNMLEVYGFTEAQFLMVSEGYTPEQLIREYLIDETNQEIEMTFEYTVEDGQITMLYNGAEQGSEAYSIDGDILTYGEEIYTRVIG